MKNRLLDTRICPLTCKKIVRGEKYREGAKNDSRGIFDRLDGVCSIGDLILIGAEVDQ